jgi:hypothetical protein
MPVQTDYPESIGNYNDWGLWGSAPDKVTAVRTQDADASVIYGFSRGGLVNQTFGFPVILGVGDPVVAASVHCEVREYQPGNASRYFYLMWNSAQAGANLGELIHLNGGAYTEEVYNAGAATLAAVNGWHGVSMQSVSGTGFEVWVTRVWRVVEYGFTGSAAGSNEFAHIIGSLAAVIGGNLLLREMPRLNRALGRVKLRENELEPAWRAWKARKNAVWSV